MFLNGLHITHFKIEEIVNKYVTTGNFSLLSAYFQNCYLIYQYVFEVLFDKYFRNHRKSGIDIRHQFMLYFKECLDLELGLKKSVYVYKHREEEFLNLVKS